MSKNLGALHECFTSEGWREVVKLATEKKDGAMLQLASVTRPPNVSDDTLRGYISALTWVLSLEGAVNRLLAEKVEDESLPNEESGLGSPMAPEGESPTTG